jgi:hypothetical protein
MNERIDRVEAEIAALKEEFYSLLDKENRSKSEQYKVDNFEKELARLGRLSQDSCHCSR